MHRTLCKNITLSRSLRCRAEENRIAAVTIMLVAVLGLGLAGYIQVTRASGKDTVAKYVHSNGTGFRLNHQRGSGAYEFTGIENQYASNFEEDSTQLASNASAGSNEPENSDDNDAADKGTTTAYGAGAGSGFGSDVPAGGPPGAGGDGDQGPSTLRLAGTFSSGYSGGFRAAVARRVVTRLRLPRVTSPAATRRPISRRRRRRRMKGRAICRTRRRILLRRVTEPNDPGPPVVTDPGRRDDGQAVYASRCQNLRPSACWASVSRRWASCAVGAARLHKESRSDSLTTKSPPYGGLFHFWEAPYSQTAQITAISTR